MKLTEYLVAGRDAVADDESPGTMPEVKREPTEDDEKPDYMRNMIFAPKEPPKLRRSSVNNEVRPCMVHLYSHRRLRKELEDRGLNAVGSRADCTDRLLCFLSGQPQPNSCSAVKKHLKRKIVTESPATVAIAKLPEDEEIKPTLDKKRRFWLPKAENTEENLEELLFDKETTPPTILKSHRNFVGEFDEVDDLGGQIVVSPELLANFVYAKHLPDVIFILVPPTFRCEGQPRLTTAHNTLYSFIKSIGAEESVILTMDSPDQNDETVFGAVNCFTDIIKREITKQRDRDNRELGGKRIVLVGWGLSCYLNHRALKSVAGVSALIDLAFHMKTQHGIGGGPDNDHVIYTYCPTLFVVGDEAESYDQDALQKMRASMLCETAVITIPHADENLLVPAAELFRHGVCQFAVFKNIASDIIDFLRSQMDEDSIPDSGLPSLPTPLVILNSSARVLAARAHFNEVLKKARFPETVRPKLQPTIMPRSCPIAQRKDYLESADGRTPYPTFDIRPPYRIVLKTMKGGTTPRPSNRSRVNTKLPQACSVSFTAPTLPPVPPHRYLVWPPIQRPRPVSSSISLSEVPQPHYKNSNDPADISIM